MSEPTAQDLADAITDVGRVVTRLGTRLDALADASKPTSTGTDVPLLVELHVMHSDALACGATARSRREREAFESMASRLDRLIGGRGGRLVTPGPGDAFDAATMEAAEVVDTDDPARHHTVLDVLAAGLSLTEPARSVRPARVIVQRHRG